MGKVNLSPATTNIVMASIPLVLAPLSFLAQRIGSVIGETGLESRNGSTARMRVPIAEADAADEGARQLTPRPLQQLSHLRAHRIASVISACSAKGVDAA